MTTPSKTVAAVQQLLAEREQVGLRKYGTTVDRTDLQAGDWLQHAIEEAADLLLYLVRLRETMPCACKDRPDSQCPGEWEAGCDLGNNEAHIRVSPPEASAALDAALGIDRTGQDRAAYLARWEDAPEWAEWLAEDEDGGCFWFDAHPALMVGGWSAWELKATPSRSYPAGKHLLSIVKCERRPGL